MPTPDAPEILIADAPDDRDPAVDPADAVIEDQIPPAAATAAPAVDSGALLKSLASGGADPLSLLLSQISGKAADDPSMNLLTQLLQQRHEPPPPPEVDEEAQVEAEERVTELSGMIDALYAEAGSLRARVAELADALGACSLCFGSDLLCRRCGGRGLPGARPPEPQAYRTYVVPAVMRVRRIVEAQRRGDPSFGPQPGRPPAFSDQGADNA